MNISFTFHDLWVFPMFRHPVLIVFSSCGVVELQGEAGGVQ
jgi:hypothetical protein